MEGKCLVNSNSMALSKEAGLRYNKIYSGFFFNLNPVATICVVAQHRTFTSCDSKTCPMFTSLGKCHICSPRGKFCVSVYLTINLKLPTVRTGDPPPFSCVMDINSANLNLNLEKKKQFLHDIINTQNTRKCVQL